MPFRIYAVAGDSTTGPMGLVSATSCCTYHRVVPCRFATDVAWFSLILRVGGTRVGFHIPCYYQRERVKWSDDIASKYAGVSWTSEIPAGKNLPDSCSGTKCTMNRAAGPLPGDKVSPERRCRLKSKTLFCIDQNGHNLDLRRRDVEISSRS